METTTVLTIEGSNVHPPSVDVLINKLVDTATQEVTKATAASEVAHRICSRVTEMRLSARQAQIDSADASLVILAKTIGELFDQIASLEQEVKELKEKGENKCTIT